MKRSLALILLGGLVAVQFAVLYAMIAGNERVLREGQPFRFRTRPFDPHDPFQGRYVQLIFEDNYIPQVDSGRPRFGATIYATIATNDQGFAGFVGGSLTPPATKPYLKTRCLGDHMDWSQNNSKSKRDGISVAMPFNRFYMDETKAPLAEKAVWDAARATNCFAAVRVLNGRAVIEDVIVHGQSIRALKRR
jgi:uncharacterized membrane-anchored protein